MPLQQPTAATHLSRRSSRLRSAARASAWLVGRQRMRAQNDSCGASAAVNAAAAASTFGGGGGAPAVAAMLRLLLVVVAELVVVKLVVELPATARAAAAAAATVVVLTHVLQREAVAREHTAGAAARRSMRCVCVVLMVVAMMLLWCVAWYEAGWCGCSIERLSRYQAVDDAVTTFKHKILPHPHGLTHQHAYHARVYKIPPSRVQATAQQPRYRNTLLVNIYLTGGRLLFELL